jgi:hypothetical protein
VVLKTCEENFQVMLCDQCYATAAANVVDGMKVQRWVGTKKAKLRTQIAAIAN